MSQHIINIRVRPPRVTVLINQEAGAKELCLAIELFSRVWGGRFGQILVVQPQECEELTSFRLGQSRPDFVYGIGLSDKYWAKRTCEVCQPRGYGALKPEFVADIRNARENFILVDHALIHLFESRQIRRRRQKDLRLISADKESAWSPYCAALFGVHHDNVSHDYFDRKTAFEANESQALIDLATEFVVDWQQSWLDVTGHELDIRTVHINHLPPTIVLVGSPLDDLALFWNLRSATDSSQPAWIIPIPASGATEPKVLDKLKTWILAFLPYGSRPNYCEVTSQSVDAEDCRKFADVFQESLSGSPIEIVTYERPRNRLPVVVPYEYYATWPFNITGRKLTFQPPRPKAFDGIGSRAWFVDLVQDVTTGRAPKELYLPPNPAMLEVLNGPCPPYFEHAAILRNSDGTDSINIRCSETKGLVNVYLPRSDEIFSEILREYGVEPLADEKRSSYLPVIKRFGGLNRAASAFSTQSGSILVKLAESTMTPAEIQGACKLGKGQLADQNYLDRIEPTLKLGSERMKRIARQRFSEYATKSSVADRELKTLLEQWADRGVLIRNWRIGPCQQCRQKYFVSSLNIQRRTICSNCGHRIRLPAKVPIGYTLQRAVQHAIQEGIIPVSLTGRFLRGMTNRGFLWLPGCKYKLGEEEGDIDLLACCDGHLVFCECKCLEHTPQDAQTWDGVLSQFRQLAAVAKKCGASLVVLAAQVDAYPPNVIQSIDSEMGTNLPYLLLNREDLDAGHRIVENGGARRPFLLRDVIPEPLPESPRDSTAGPRRIEFGYATFTAAQ